MTKRFPMDDDIDAFAKGDMTADEVAQKWKASGVLTKTKPWGDPKRTMVEVYNEAEDRDWFGEEGWPLVPKAVGQGRITFAQQQELFRALTAKPAEPTEVQASALRNRVHARPFDGAVVAGRVGRWTEALHPRGADGQFIKKGALVDLIGMSGFQHGQRGSKTVQGKVAEVLPDGKIRVEVTDKRWDAAQFGETVDVPNNKVIKRVGPKGTLPKTPKAVPAKPKPAPVLKSDGTIPDRTPTPDMVPAPHGPGMKPIKVPAGWDDMDNEERLLFLKNRMEDDYLAWRGQPTEFDFDGFDPGIAFNLANTYRDLTNWDPDTAMRIDKPIISSTGGTHGLGGTAIAVAHPGTAHPGGIGPKIKESAIVLGSKYASSMGWWKHHQATGGKWSTSTIFGDPTVTLIHEFAHQRQFRFLDVAMRDVGKAWSPVVTEDGFGLVPDSSNWKEVQDMRYSIPKLTQTDYGHSKSSEGFAEAWAERMTGISSPELNTVLDAWDERMGLMLQLPQDRYEESTNYDDLTEAEKSAFWQEHGHLLDLPGMRDHYPESAAAFDKWKATQAEPVSEMPDVDGQTKILRSLFPKGGTAMIHGKEVRILDVRKVDGDPSGVPHVLVQQISPKGPAVFMRAEKFTTVNGKSLPTAASYFDFIKEHLDQ